MSEFLSTRTALKVMSSRFPIGVETIYKLLLGSFIYEKKFNNNNNLYINFFNSNLLSDEKKSVLKVGLLAPLSGEYKELGNSLIFITTSIK